MTATIAPVKSLDSLRAGAVEVRVTSNRKRTAPLTQATMIRTLINTGWISAFLIDRQYVDLKIPVRYCLCPTWRLANAVRKVKFRLLQLISDSFGHCESVSVGVRQHGN